ncbi:MAG: tyrosine-type recombinase/integrase [Bifidobacterium sp.]
MGLCGLRWGEATALTVRDVDFKRNRLHVSKGVTKVGTTFEQGTPKSNKARDVPMPQLVRDALREQVKGKKPTDLLLRESMVAMSLPSRLARITAAGTKRRSRPAACPS